MKRLKQNQGITYVFITIITFLLVGTFFWFFFWAAIAPLDETLTPLANAYHNETWPLYDQLQYAESFMTNLWKYLLVFGILGVLALWVFMYSQHRGQPY